MAAINLNHNEGSITIDDDKVLQITKNGAIKIGNGSFMEEIDPSDLSEILKDYEGVIRYDELSKTIQYCDGTQWKTFCANSSAPTGIIWSLTF